MKRSIFLLVFILMSANANESAFRELDCQFKDCSEKEKIIIKEKIIEKPIIIEKTIINNNYSTKNTTVNNSVDNYTKNIPNNILRTCEDIKKKYPESKSDYYTVIMKNKEIRVFCEMSILGGGWTRVWMAKGYNYNQSMHEYSIPFEFVENSKLTMMSYDVNNRQYNPFVFKTPKEWKIQHPMSIARGVNKITTIDPLREIKYENVELIFGNEGFSGKCEYSFSGGKYGAICIKGTNAPFYSGFNIDQYDKDTYSDNCSLSNEHYNRDKCDRTKKLFSIFVR